MTKKCINQDGTRCEHATITINQDRHRKAVSYNIECSIGGKVKTVLSLKNAKGVDCDIPMKNKS